MAAPVDPGALPTPRVVYISPVGEVGGAERCLLDLMAAVADAWPGIERHLIACAPGPLVERAGALGVRAEELPLPAALARLGDSGLRGRGHLAAAARVAGRAGPHAWSLLAYGRRLNRRLRALDPSLIHTNGLKAHLLAWLAAPRSVPVVWHLHDFLGSRPVAAHILRRAAGRAARMIAVSEAVGRDARAVLGTRSVAVVRNAVDLERFTPGPGRPADLDALAGLPPASADVVRVGLVATYARWKGQDAFLEAIARVPAGPPARFFVVGGPIYQTAGSQFTEDELRRLAGRPGVSDRVGFVPFQEDTAWIYRALDLVVHASTRPEPFGLTIAEAMACARPVIVTAAGGAVELFTEGLDALGVDPGDPATLARLLTVLIADPDRRARLGAEARRTALRRFARERLGREVVAVYRSILPGT